MGCIFFDLDGVIIDSRTAIGSCVDETLLACGMAVTTADEIIPFIGPPVLCAFEELLRGRGRDPRGAVALVGSFRERYARVSLTQTVLVPQMTGVIEALHVRHRLAVATSKAQHLALPILETFNVSRWFDAIVGPAADAFDETKTQTLMRAVALLEAGADRTMIGDRRHDIAAGRHTGCRTIGVTWGIGSRAELSTAGADVIVDQPRELLDVLGA